MLDEKFSIRKLDDSHQRQGFVCGEETLDEYIKKYASQDYKRHVTTIYILNDEIKNKVAGYYSLSSTSIELSALSDFAKKNLPRYPLLPAILLGRFAIDIHYQRKGWGEILLIHALKLSYQVSHEVASCAVVVDAINDTAFAFYQKHKFIPIVNNRLYLPMQAIEKLI